MLNRKVCIIGDFGVGKTSTVARFVHNVFSEKYLTTVGVKIDTKEIMLADERPVKLVIWDIAGTDRFAAVEFSYLRGVQGYLLVVDGTRAYTLESALKLKSEVEERIGVVPFVCIVNKADLEDQWEITNEQLEELRKDGFRLFKTSAKSGDNVETALETLAESVAGP